MEISYDQHSQAMNMFGYQKPFLRDWHWLLLWAHGLHLLFFPVWPVYNIDVCLDRLPSIPQKLRTFGDC